MGLQKNQRRNLENILTNLGSDQQIISLTFHQVFMQTSHSIMKEVDHFKIKDNEDDYNFRYLKRPGQQNTNHWMGTLYVDE